MQFTYIFCGYHLRTLTRFYGKMFSDLRHRDIVFR